MQAAPKRVGRDLTQGPVLKGLLLFSLPMLLTNLIQQLYSIVDLMVIGQFVGTTGTVGVSIGGELSDFLSPVAMAFASAGQIYIAQLAGAKRDKEQRDAIGSFLSLMMLSSLVFTVGTLLLRAQLLALLNCPPEAYAQAESYLIITALGMPFVFGYNAVCGILRGMGESKQPIIFIIVAATVNIVLDLLLVIVFRMDAAGTAIATTFSQAASFLAAFLFMYRNRKQFGFEMKWDYFKLRWAPLKIILGLGIPQAARSILVRISMLWVNSSINAYGLIASGTNSVGNKLHKFLEIFSQSISQAGGAMVGQNLGAKQHERAKQTVWYTFAVSLVFAVVSTVLVLVCPRALLGLFTQDEAVLTMGVTYLQIMIIHFYASALTSSFQCMVIGAGNATLNFVIGVLDGIICKIGLSLLFLYALDMGVYSYFWGTTLSRILPGILCVIYFYRGSWKTNRLLRD